MKRLPPLTLFLWLAATTAFAGEATVQFRITGLFQPDRKKDLQRQAGTLRTTEKEAPSEVTLREVDYETTVATFAYDPDSKMFKGAKPEQVSERINNLLRQATKGTFTAIPLSTLPREKLQEVRIGVAGLDCKGCAFGAYRAVTKIDGVEHATVSFKDGLLIAWVDSAKTNRDVLLAALTKAQVALKPE